jgi:hypothetical protein
MTAEFALRVRNEIGDITKIVLRSDASDPRSHRLVSRVVITNLQNCNQYVVECGGTCILDSAPREFICSERINRGLQPINIADNSGLLLTVSLPIEGELSIFSISPTLAVDSPCCCRKRRRPAARERVCTSYSLCTARDALVEVLL